MSKKPETRRQVRIQTYLRNAFRGIYVRKVHGGPFTHGGMGDLLICFKGLFITLEVKEPGKELDPLQEEEQKEVRKAGGIYERVEDPEEAIFIVREALNVARKTRR